MFSSDTETERAHMRLYSYVYVEIGKQRFVIIYAYHSIVKAAYIYSAVYNMIQYLLNIIKWDIRQINYKEKYGHGILTAALNARNAHMQFSYSKILNKHIKK